MSENQLALVLARLQGQALYWLETIFTADVELTEEAQQYLDSERTRLEKLTAVFAKRCEAEKSHSRKAVA
jgi:ABC-type enterochelin transport system substrate-binding protein